MSDEWKDDGHVLIVEADAAHPDDRAQRIACPGPPGACPGPYLCCMECNGSGYRYDDDDEEQPCPDCDESGMESGERTCWLSTHAHVLDVEDRDGTPGTFALLYRSYGSGEDFELEMRRGPQVDPASTGGEPS